MATSRGPGRPERQQPRGRHAAEQEPPPPRPARGGGRPGRRSNRRRSRRLSPPGQNQRSRTGPPAGYIQRPRCSSIHLTASVRQPGPPGVQRGQRSCPRSRAARPAGARAAPRRRTSSIARGVEVLEDLDGDRRRRTSRRRTGAAAPRRGRDRARPASAEHRRREVEPDDLAPAPARAAANRPLPQPRSRIRRRRRSGPRRLEDRRSRASGRRSATIALEPRRAAGRTGAATLGLVVVRRSATVAIMRPSARVQLAVLPVPDGDRQARERAEHEPLDAVAEPLLAEVELEERPERPERQVARPEPPPCAGRARAASRVV